MTQSESVRLLLGFQERLSLLNTGVGKMWCFCMHLTSVRESLPDNVAKLKKNAVMERGQKEPGVVEYLNETAHVDSQ